MKKPHYSPFGRFVLRTPLFPLGGLAERGELSGSPVFREAIRLASPELANTVPPEGGKKRWKYDNSVLKYFHRSCTRSTPFGLFAGCTVGSLGPATRIELAEAERWRRCTRLDMQYLCALIQEVEKMPEMRAVLRYYPNDSLYELGGRLRYIEYRYNGSRRVHQVSAVEPSEYLSTLLEVAASGATADALARSVAGDDVSIGEASAFVEELIDAQVLKSELDPCVVGSDVLTRLIDLLSASGGCPVLEKVKEIRDLLARVDSAPIGTATDLYDVVTGRIKEIGVGYEDKYLFQTDLYKPAAEAAVSERIGERLSELAEFLARISAPYSQTRLTQFRDAFSARYEEMEIPLAEALDVELGIGYPAQSSGAPDSLIAKLALPPGNGRGKSQTAYDAVDVVMLRKLLDCFRSGETVIKLADEDFKDVRYEHELPDTLAVMCSILGDDPGTCPVYLRSMGGATAAALLGRFCHLDPEMEGLVREIAAVEAAAAGDGIVAEISHLPESRIGNIASRPSVRDYVIHYLSGVEDGEGAIPLSDLMLSVRNGRLHLRSKKYGRQVMPRLTCAHNYSLSPIPAYQFLCDLQAYGLTAGFGLNWNDLLRQSDYLPRVEYKGLILQRQRWMLRLHEVEDMEKLPDERLPEAAVKLIEKRRLPREVVISDSDNELYFDLQEAGSLRMLLDLVKKRKAVSLEEFLFADGRSPVKCGADTYANEFIIPFKKD